MTLVWSGCPPFLQEEAKLLIIQHLDVATGAEDDVFTSIDIDDLVVRTTGRNRWLSKCQPTSKGVSFS